VQDPLVSLGERQFLEHGGFCIGVESVQVHQRETGGVPDFVTEVAIACDSLFGQFDVATLGGESGQGKAEGVSAVLVDDGQRINHVSFGFGHLLSLGVTYQGVDIDIRKGNLIHEVQAHHHHAGYPEEKNVETGDQAGGGVEGFQFGGLIGPAHGGKRPEPGGKPGIEYVGFLTDFVAATAGAGGRVFHGDSDLAAVIAEPGRNAVPPPDLARDTPVADILHPVVVGIFPLFRQDTGFSFFYRFKCSLCQRADFHIPLQRQIRLNNGLAAIAAADRHGVVLDLVKQPCFLQFVDDAGTGGKPVHPLILVTGRIDDTGFVQYIDFVETVAQTDLKVVEVMGRGDFDHAGSELAFHIFVRNNRNFAVDQRQDHLFADQVAVTLVFGMNRHSGIAQHGFGPGGGYGDEASRFTGYRIADMPQVAFLVFMFNLDIRKRRMTARTPVDQAVVAVDQTVVVQLDKDRAHSLGKSRIHGEAFPFPVAGGAQAFQLADDLAARFRLPLPDPLDEGIPSKVVAILAFGCQLTLDYVLGGDACMVGARHPEYVVAAHPLPAAEDILKGVVEGVSHVQGAGDVRWGDDYGVWLFVRGGLGVKITLLFPFCIPSFLNIVGLVAFGKFFGHVVKHRS